VDNIIKGFREGTLYAAEFVNPCIDAKSIIDPIIAGGGSFAGWRYYVTQWQSTSTIMFLMYNRARFDPAETGLLRVAAAASLAASYRRRETKQSACLAAMAQKGMQVATLPTSVLTKLRSATSTVLARDAAANPEVAAVLESMRMFENRNGTWLNEGPISRTFRFVGWPGWGSDL
jgi:TRAP-type mannitol/chloroaromatic compound transport system substrate-binding protein